ncbi:Misato segment II tubulin-like domain-containing protein [Schizophyllum commune]
MREIVYIQSGNSANYVGSHFWNTQECYLTDEDQTVYDRRVSFRESLADNGTICYSPRALIFDHKSNFGTFAKSNILSSTENDQAINTAAVALLWQGVVDEQQSDPIPKSDYHAKLERDDEDPDAASPRVQSGASVRYWADFSRLYFGAHSFQAVPDSYTSGRSGDGDWGASRDTFARFNEETDVTDTAVRVLFEECDNPQGFQMTTDVCRFGAFAHGLVETLRDEYPKLPVLDFALLSSAVPADVEVDDTAGTRRAINDALYLREMGEVASGIVPIQNPAAWKDWAGPSVSADLSLIYHSSAIVSAHVESITLPMRQRNLNSDLSSLIASLSWRGHTTFAQLGGVLPATGAEDWAKATYNFSFGGLSDRTKADIYSRVDVLRGFNDASLVKYEAWSSRSTSAQSVVNRYQAAGYPLPSSFPPIFDARLLENPAVDDIHSISATSCLSTLTTSSAMAGLFSSYAAFLERLRRRPTAANAIDFLETDDWRELTNDFWTMHDNYDNGGSDGEIDELGEDEGQ